MNEHASPPAGLTAEQQRIAFADPCQLTLVQAGAGSGKTHTLIARIAFLADEAGLDPGDDLLVLSFSRAAIGEVRRRLSSDQRSLPFVPIRTFDSFATSILDFVDPQGAWVNAGYDGRIRAATKLMNDDHLALHDFLRARHILIDEAQDLTGDRARFVVALLTLTGATFTVFTDAAQAIYGFSEESDTRAGEQLDLVHSLTEVAADRPIERLTLTTQHRAASPATSRVMALGTKLGDPSADAQTLADELLELTESMPPIDNLGMMKRLLLRSTDRTTAFLCRTNAQALVVADELHAMGIDYRVQRNADDRTLGRWLALVAGSVDGHSLSQQRFVDLARDLPDLPPLPTEALWLGLRRMDPRSRSDVDLRRIAARTRCGDIPEDLNHILPTSTVVSTIHRSKGLEFDRVVLVPYALQDEDPAESNRVLYVGLSRARDEVLVLRNLRPTRLRIDRRVGRVVEGGFGRGGSVSGLEVTSLDTQTAVPAGSAGGAGSPVETQAYLQNQVRPGDSVTMRLANERRDQSHPPVYRVLHNDVLIAETSDYFGESLALLLRGPGARPWPPAIEGVRVQMVDTVAGDETVARSIGVSRTGLWARARIQGFGRFSVD